MSLPMQGKIAEVYEPMRYLMALGGKRFRPQLAVLAATMLGARLEDTLRPALAVEVFHNFSLMHDDIMDKAPLRRGQATVHERWNTNIAILSGDAMLVKAYELLEDLPSAILGPVLRDFNRAGLGVVEGQQLDMNYEAAVEVTMPDYLEMIRLKTAVLVGFALQLGGRLAQAQPETCAQLYGAGVQMGIGFQLYDDYLDVFGDPALVGKQPGGDILSCKKTFLPLFALSKLTGLEHGAFRKLYQGNELPPNDKVRLVTAQLHAAGADAACLAESARYYQAGLALLEGIEGAAEPKAMLIELCKQLMYRSS